MQRRAHKGSPFKRNKVVYDSRGPSGSKAFSRLAKPTAPKSTRRATYKRGAVAEQQTSDGIQTQQKVKEDAISVTVPIITEDDSVLQRTPEWVSKYQDNPALAGNFAPVADEVTIADLAVRGELPAHLDGLFVRNGPNPPYEPRTGVYHWFDGSGMVHFLRLRPERGSADYGCRYVRSRGFLEQEARDEALYLSITEEPKVEEIVRGLVSKAKNWRQPDAPYWVIQQINSANNGLTFHAGRLLATYEAGSAYELRLEESLACAGLCDFNGTWSTKDFWTENFTAHPKVCPFTGEMVYIGYNLVPTDGQPRVTVGVVDAGGAVAHRAAVACARPSMQHDVAITRTRTILLDCPLVFNMDKSLAGGRPFDFLHRGKVDKARFGVMDRHGSADSVQWVETDCCYNYHVMNAWDNPANEDQVVLITCRTEMTAALGMADIFLESDQSGAEDPSVLKECHEEATLHRFVIDLKEGAVVESTPLADFASEFPCVNRNFTGAPTRYGYSAGIRGGQAAGAITLFDAVVKHDLHTGLHERRPLGEGRLCGDITFVPDPTRPEVEDAGHLLVMSHKEGEDEAELLVIDAQDIMGEPTAVVEIPVRVPYGFHCEYVPRAGLEAWP